MPETAYLSSITPQNIIELSNKERQKAEMHALEENVYLKEAALRKAESILEEQIFEHNIKGKRFSQWIKDVGYEYSYAGENLAIDFVTAEGTVKAWMESQKHKKNLLNDKYTEIGVATVPGIFEGANTIVVAQMFGAPAKINVPLKVASRNEQFRSLDQEVLSASEYRGDALSFKKVPVMAKVKTYLSSQNATSTASAVTIAFSVFLTLILAYLYILSLNYMIEHFPHKE